MYLQTLLILAQDTPLAIPFHKQEASEQQEDGLNNRLRK